MTSTIVDAEDAVVEPPWRQRWLPMALLATGTPVSVLLWANWVTGAAGRAAIVIAAFLAMQVLVFTPAMFAALLAAARWLDAELGLLLPTLRKIAALTLGPAAVADVLFVATLVLADFEWALVVAGFGYYMVLTGPTIALLFGYGVAETALVTVLNFAARVPVIYAAASLLGNASWIG